MIQSPEAPRGSFGATLEYIPSRGISVWHGAQWNGSGTWAYDSVANEWTQWLDLEETYFNDEAPRSEAIINYDGTNDVLVAFNQSTIYIYDFEDNSWMIQGEGPFSEVRLSVSASAYDTYNGIHLLRTTDTLFVYDFATSSTESTLPIGGLPENVGMTYYDQSHNVFVFYFDHNERHWVYRYAL